MKYPNSPVMRIPAGGRSMARSSASRAPSRPRWHATVIEAIHDQFPGRPRLAELAALARVHPVHLAQSFARHQGCSIGGYVERLRVRAVSLALGRRGETLAEIAAATGFADQSHMTRVFRRHMGTTPARYRSSLVG